ncbi:hypothetical protein HY311_01515 [Candidatus Nomurabacteria bacterium]|nr:hypothetical protein [Candidatus Nomurabacteria bacterium]
MPQIKNKKLKIIFSITLGVLLPMYFIHASDLTSPSFIIRDPVVSGGGGYESSGSFKLYSSENLFGAGQSSSTSFIERSGLLYYPYVTKGTLSAILNGSNVDLTWTPTTAGLGYNVASYKVGIATVSGGPYAYTPVGLSLNYTYTNLSAGDYFFVVGTLDNNSNLLTLSSEQTVTIPQVISFSISTNTVGFGVVTPSGARFATNDTSGSSTDASGNSLQVSTNATSGYSISYNGTAFAGPEVLTEATITNDPDGLPSTKQFALAFSADNGATITSSYDHNVVPANRNWKFTTGSNQLIVTKSNPTPLETINAYYLANIAAMTSAGNYGGVITYTATANF